MWYIKLGGGGGGEKKGDHKRIKKDFWDGGIKESKKIFWDVAKKLAKRVKVQRVCIVMFYRVKAWETRMYYGEGLLVTQQQGL